MGRLQEPRRRRARRQWFDLGGGLLAGSLLSAGLGVSRRLSSGFGCVSRLIARGVRNPALLVDESQESVGEVAGQGFQEAGELHHGGRDGAGKLGEQDLSRLDLGQGLGLGGGEGLRAQHAALHDEARVGPGEVSQCFGHVDRIAGRAIGPLGDEGDRGGAGEQLLQLQAEFAGGEADERVLVDLVLAAGLPQRPTQAADGGDVEPSVLGEQRCAGGTQALTQLVHHCDLLRSRVLH